jgi:methyltransferase (TIGR00027 family)
MYEESTPRTDTGAGQTLSFGVGSTALLTAQARATEHRRPDRLFADPWAEKFLAASGTDTPAQPVDVDLVQGDYFALRTRFFDDHLLDACATGCLRVVVLAAGLDSRAFRLPWPGSVRLFELDMPAVLRFKDDVLDTATPQCERITVPCDLRQDWPTALRNAGFRDDEPTAWAAEGVLFYLTDEDCDRLIADIGRLSAPGSRLTAEHVNRALFQMTAARPLLDALADLDAAWQSGVDEPNAWLAGHGWQARALDPTGLAHRYGRPIPPFVGYLDYALAWLMDATRG